MYLYLRAALEVCVEERVHEGGLAQARLADAHDVEREPVLNGLVNQLEKILYDCFTSDHLSLWIEINTKSIIENIIFDQTFHFQYRFIFNIGESKICKITKL